MNKKQINRTAKMFSLLLIFFFCLSLVSCTSKSNEEKSMSKSGKEKSMSKSEEEKSMSKSEEEKNKISVLREHLSSRLYYPSSIQFSKVIYQQVDDEEIWIGKFNTKNRKGAYIGFQDFAFVINKTDKTKKFITRSKDQPEDEFRKNDRELWRYLLKIKKHLEQK